MFSFFQITDWVTFWWSKLPLLTHIQKSRYVYLIKRRLTPYWRYYWYPRPQLFPNASFFRGLLFVLEMCIPPGIQWLGKVSVPASYPFTAADLQIHPLLCSFVRLESNLKYFSFSLSCFQFHQPYISTEGQIQGQRLPLSSCICSFCSAVWLHGNSGGMWPHKCCWDPTRRHPSHQFLYTCPFSPDSLINWI